MALSAARSHRLLLVVAGCALVLLLLAALPLTRGALLRSVGRALVAQDAIRHADVVVISIDADGAGVLEAADLLHQGWATRVALFPDPPDPVDREFLRRGVPYSNRAAVATMQLRSLGIEQVELIPWSVTGTTDEGDVLRRWCAQQRIGSIIFVATADHSRRARRMLQRALRGSATQVTVRYSPYSEFDPEGWWRSRNGVRIEVFEAQKLLADLLRHPFS